jgi:hypothetical protein
LVGQLAEELSDLDARIQRLEGGRVTPPGHQVTRAEWHTPGRTEWSRWVVCPKCGTFLSAKRTDGTVPPWPELDGYQCRADGL